jgi:hypothetical protein
VKSNSEKYLWSQHLLPKAGKVELEKEDRLRGNGDECLPKRSLKNTPTKLMREKRMNTGKWI